MRWVMTTVFDTWFYATRVALPLPENPGKRRAICNQILPSSTCSVKWQRQTKWPTLPQEFLKICCPEWSPCRWFWTKEPGPPGSACHLMEWAYPWQGIHSHIYTQTRMYTNKHKSISGILAKTCILAFLFRPGKTITFFAECPEMAELASTDVWCSTVIWHGTSHVAQVWHQWPRTKVCSFSWKLLSWVLITGCHPATTADEVGCFGSQIVLSLTLHWQILTQKKVRS